MQDYQLICELIYYFRYIILWKTLSRFLALFCHHSCTYFSIFWSFSSSVYFFPGLFGCFPGATSKSISFLLNAFLSLIYLCLIFLRSLDRLVRGCTNLWLLWDSSPSPSVFNLADVQVLFLRPKNLALFLLW